jgi:transcription factor MBP1
MFEPLTGYVPSAESPPPAPKHVIASSNRAKKVIPGVEALRAARRPASIETESETASAMKADGTEGSISSPASVVSSTSRTPSPIAHGGGPDFFDGSGMNGSILGYGRQGANAAYDVNPAAQYADIILNYFISETTTIPSLLITPPVDFDPNMSIDDDEHTALHWACAMGRIRVVKLLLTAGADVFRVNNNGQTALMRAAMFSNNYDLRKFPELFELLHRSILNIDRTIARVWQSIGRYPQLPR